MSDPFSTDDLRGLAARPVTLLNGGVAKALGFFNAGLEITFRADILIMPSDYIV